MCEPLNPAYHCWQTFSLLGLERSKVKLQIRTFGHKLLKIHWNVEFCTKRFDIQALILKSTYCAIAFNLVPSYVYLSTCSYVSYWVWCHWFLVCCPLAFVWFHIHCFKCICKTCALVVLYSVVLSVFGCMTIGFCQGSREEELLNGTSMGPSWLNKV